MHGSNTYLVNPKSIRTIVTCWYHARGACLRPYNAFFSLRTQPEGTHTPTWGLIWMTYSKSAYEESTIHICLVTLEVEPKQWTVVETPFAVQARRFRSSLLLSIAKTSEAKSRSPLDRLIICVLPLKHPSGVMTVLSFVRDNNLDVSCFKRV